MTFSYVTHSHAKDGKSLEICSVLKPNGSRDARLSNSPFLGGAKDTSASLRLVFFAAEALLCTPLILLGSRRHCSADKLTASEGFVAGSAATYFQARISFLCGRIKADQGIPPTDPSFTGLRPLLFPLVNDL